MDTKKKRKNKKCSWLEKLTYIDQSVLETELVSEGIYVNRIAQDDDGNITVSFDHSLSTRELKPILDGVADRVGAVSHKLTSPTQAIFYSTVMTY